MIVIGSGAGGGTLVHRLAPSGKRILLLERGDWLPREPQNWRARGRVRRQPLRLAGHLVRRRRQAVPAAGALLRRRRDEALRRRALPPARGGLRRAAPPRRHLTRLADLLRRARALLHPGRAALPGARRARARTRPSRRPARPIPSRRSPTSRGSSSSPTTSRPPGHHPFHAPCGIMLERGQHALQPLRPLSDCDGFPCLVHAKSDAEVLAVRPALEHPNVTLLTNAEAVRLEHERRRHRGHRGRGRARGRDARRTPATSSWSHAGRRTRPSCSSCRRATSIPNGLANGSDQVGRNFMFHDSVGGPGAVARRRTRPIFQKTLGLNDFYFGSDDFDYPLGNIQMVGKSQAADVPGREAGGDEAGARVDARADRPPRGRLLALDRGPAASREPGHSWTATAS